MREETLKRIRYIERVPKGIFGCWYIHRAQLIVQIAYTLLLTLKLCYKVFWLIVEGNQSIIVVGYIFIVHNLFDFTTNFQIFEVYANLDI